MSNNSNNMNNIRNELKSLKNQADKMLEEGTYLRSEQCSTSKHIDFSEVCTDWTASQPIIALLIVLLPELKENEAKKMKTENKETKG
jgi:hypothetical protein